APAATPAPSNQISPERPGDIRYRDRRLIALYFDMSSMPEVDQLRALSAAQKFITTQIKPVDLVSIMEYASGAIKVITDFTDDRDKLLTAINTLVVGEDDGMTGTTSDASTADTGAAFGQDDSEFNLFTTDRQLSALQTAVNMLKSLNEQKSLV